MKRKVEDSIRDAQVSHRKPAVADAIKEARQLRLAEKGTEITTVHPDALPEKQVGIAETLPHSAENMAKLGLTTILPPAKVKKQRKFLAFVEELASPDFQENYPTFGSMARRFDVDERTIKSWLLSKEVTEALDASVTQKAKLRMPSIMESVARRAEMTGDPHAAEWVARQAGRNKNAGGSGGGVEISIRMIAERRAKEAEDPNVITVDSES